MIDSGAWRIPCEESLPLLLAGVSRLGIALDSIQKDRFVAYCRLLDEGNRRANLTGIRAPDAIMTSLFLDSLTVDAALPPEIRSSTGVRLVDVGSGAGFPGLPLAIMHPNWPVLLVDSTGKKVSFMTRVISDLGLKHAAAQQERAEAMGAGKPWREAADLCTARAVASLDVLLEYCVPLVRIGGWLAFPKSGDVAAEIARASDAARTLGAAPGDIVPVPPDLGLGDGRATVLYRKVRPTPPGYPRRIGLAKTRPISPRSQVPAGNASGRHSNASSRNRPS